MLCVWMFVVYPLFGLEQQHETVIEVLFANLMAIRLGKLAVCFQPVINLKLSAGSRTTDKACTTLSEYPKVAFCNGLSCFTALAG